MVQKFDKLPVNSDNIDRQFRHSFLWSYMKLRGLQIGAATGLTISWLYFIAPAQFKMLKNAVLGK